MSFAKNLNIKKFKLGERIISQGFIKLILLINQS